MTDDSHPLQPRPLTRLSEAVPSAPEDQLVFRLAQLTLLLEIAARDRYSIKTIDRLGFYDFFAANPFVVISDGQRGDDTDRLTLRLAGFTDQQLSYASTGQRFASRRRRLQHDMALMLAYRLVTIDADGYALTDAGRGVAESLNSVYADAYRDAAQIVLRRLGRLSNRRLTEAAERWLGQSWLLLDLLDDIAETTPSTQPTPDPQPRAEGRHGGR